MISIIVPVYNTEKYLKRCLESLIHQTFRDIEIICVIKNCEDYSLDICNSYSKLDKRILIILQDSDGLGNARNEGLLNARGKYIQFCDSDDYYDITMCERLYNSVEEFDVDIVVTGIKPFFEEYFHPKKENPYFNVPYAGKYDITNDVFKHTNVFVWNKLFLSSVINKYNIKFPGGLYCEDACFFYKYLMVSKTIYYIDDPLYFYFTARSGSLMFNSSIVGSVRAMDHVHILKDIYSFVSLQKFNKENISAFLWIVITYMSLALKFCGKESLGEIFKIGAGLVKNIDYDQEIEKVLDYYEFIQFCALKQNNFKLYYWAGNQIETADNPKNKFVSALKSCFLFPWYIYRIFCFVYNIKKPVKKPTVFLKIYLFFPYYALKTLNTMSMRAEQCNL